MENIKYQDLTLDQSGLCALIGSIPMQVLNMSTRIDILSDIDEEKMLEALRLTVKRLSYCNVRLHKMPDGTIKQYFSDCEPEGIELVDMSRDSEKKVDAYFRKLAERPFPNENMDCPLYNFKLVRKADGHALFLCAIHIIVDAYSLMYLVTYFDKVYSALVNGTELPPENHYAQELVEWSYKFCQSPRYAKDQALMDSTFDTEPHFTSLNGLGSPEFVKGKRYGRCQNLTQFGCASLPLRIPAEQISRINAAAGMAHVSPQAYFMLALRTYLARVSGTDDVYFCTTAARRATLLQKNGGMTFAHMLDFRTVMSEELSFENALQTVSAAQNNTYRHASGILTDSEARLLKARFGTPDNMQYRSVVLTYQPYFNTDNVDIKFRARFLNPGLAAYPLYINMMPMDNSGDLWADYLYAKNYIKPENIEKFHNFMLKFLDAGIAAPEKSVKQLVDECI